MKLSQAFSLWMALTLVLTACPTRKVERRPHEGPVSEQPDVQLPNIQASSVHFDQAPLEQAQTALKTAKADLYKDVIVPLSEYVMNPKYVESPQFAGTLRMRAMLSAYNRALLQLIDAKAPVVRGEQLLEKYQKMLFSGCAEDIADLSGCVNVKFFRVDPLTSKLVQRMAAADPKLDVKRYYKLLALSYELQNRTKDKELEFMYFRRAREYSKFFNDLPESDKEKPLIRRHGIIFETLLRDFVANPKDPDFRTFVFEFEPWKYSRLTPNNFRYGTQRLFQLVAENYLYEKDGSLNKDLRAEIKAVQINTDPKLNDPLGPSFTQIVARLNAGEYKDVLKSLGVKYDSVTNGSVQDEYFFIIDRLYRGHLSVDEAIQIWKGAKPNPKRLLETIELYLRVQLVNELIATNEFMRNIYDDPKYDSSSMIKKVLEESKEISDKWMEMLERIEFLKRLVNSQLKTFGHDSVALKDTNKMFDSIRRNIKYMAVYPNMFLMSYFLARNKAKFTVHSWYGKFEVDHTLLINAFMEGMLAPWFRFGNDELPLTKIEMMYAYYFALNNGSFETFSKIKDVSGEAAVDRVRFLKEIIKEYMGGDNQALRLAVEKQNSLFSSNAYGQFLEYCAREKSGDRSFTIEMDFSKIGSFTYIGGGGPHTSALMAQTPFTFYNETLGTLNAINRPLRLKLTTVRTMIDILKDDLSKRGLSAAETKRSTEEIESIVNETERFRRSFVNGTVARHREIGDCVERARELEFERQRDLYREEIAHLRAVYRDISELQTLSGKALKDKELEFNLKYGFTRDAASSTGDDPVSQYKHDVVTQKYYRYSKFDLYMRMANRMSRMKPYTRVTMPSDLNLSVDFYRNKDGNPINFLDSKGSPVSEDEFVSAAMRALSGLSIDNYIRWGEHTVSNDFNQQKIDALTSLFQITHGNPEFKEQIGPKDVIKEVLNMVELATIKNDEVEIFRLMGRERRVSIEDLRRFMIDTKSGEELPVLENAFKSMTKSDLQLDEAKQFFLAMKHSGYFLFSPSQQVLDLMRNQYQPLVDGVRLRSKDLIAAAKAESEKLTVKQLSFPFELSANGFIYYKGGVGPGNKAQLLSQRSEKDVQASERDFDRETENYFKGGQ